MFYPIESFVSGIFYYYTFSLLCALLDLLPDSLLECSAYRLGGFFFIILPFTTILPFTSWCIFTSCCSSIVPWMNSLVVFTFTITSHTPLKTHLYILPSVLLGICLEMESLTHILILFLLFWETTTLFSAALSYLHLFLINTYPSGCEGVSLRSFDVH